MPRLQRPGVVRARDGREHDGGDQHGGCGGEEGGMAHDAPGLADVSQGTAKSIDVEPGCDRRTGRDDHSGFPWTETRRNARAGRGKAEAKPGTRRGKDAPGR